jgi:hypothetical protein
MQSMPTLKDTDPHDVFAIESLLHAHAEKMPHAEKAPPLAHDPAAPVAPQVHVAPPISVGAPKLQTEPTFSAPVARDIKPRGEIPADNVRPGEIKVDSLKVLQERPTAKWVRRTFMALLGLVGAIAAAAWQHYGDDATAMAAEWTPSFVLAALPSAAKPAVAEQPNAPVTETAAADQTAQPTPAAAAAPAPAEPAAAAAAPAPSAESTQLQSMAQDLAAMGQQVEELKSTIAQLKASQAQMARELAKASETKASESRPSEAARAAVVAPPPAARPAAPPPVRKPKPVSSHTPSHSPAPMAAAPVAPPPPVQAVAAPPPPATPRQTIADDGEPVVRPPMPLR